MMFPLKSCKHLPAHPPPPPPPPRIFVSIFRALSRIQATTDFRIGLQKSCQALDLSFADLHLLLHHHHHHPHHFLHPPPSPPSPPPSLPLYRVFLQAPQLSH